MIELKNLNKYFNKGKKNEIHVINDTSLTLPDTGMIALLGPSGCGKTTLLNVIGGLDSTQKGTVLLNGKKMTSGRIGQVDKLRTLTVGYIFQDYKLLEDKNVYDNVAIALKMVGIKNKDEIKVRVEYVLDKVGMLRYRYRPVSMLSGGERQRVGIARALVKNPDVVLADEPTGNLDSKNSVEIMNIIKTISREKLVILVTHERKLAEFYASRIIEIIDGKVTSDRENLHDNELDYELDNIFYLKEFQRQETYQKDKDMISVFASPEDPINLRIVVKNGNLYIQSPAEQHIEVVDADSGIELVDDYKKNVDKESIADYDFHLEQVGNQSLPRKYTSIQNLFRAFLNGFKKIGSYPIMRKILLLGFVLAGCFIVFSFARIGSVLHVEQKDYITDNASYLGLESPGLSVAEYNKLSERDDIEYVLPGNGRVTLRLYPERFYQTRSASFSVGGSLTDVAVLKQEDLRYGRLPKDSAEVVLDRMTIKYLLEGTPQVKMVNMHTPEDFLGKQLGLTNGINYTVVGITDLQEPNIYLNRDQFIPALYYSYPSGEDYDGIPYLQMARAKYADSPYQIYSEEESNSLLSYELEKERYSLKQGRLPENAYECLLPYEQRDVYPLGKVTDVAIGKQKLKVVGYYTTNDTSLTTALVSNQTLLYDLVQGAKKYTICPKTADCYDNLAKEEYKVINLLQRAENDYRKARKETVRSTILLGGIIIAISLIELFLISRSSFLSRIKEVGTLRAIGMKKWDVYKIFVGEVLAITTLTDLPAMILTFFFIQWGISAYPSVSMFFYQTPLFLLAAVFLIYLFNLLVGLLPVWNTMRKRPAAILARYDID